jgi:PPK2 family polyphosphate:nucleotide phosphotransferase
MVTPARAAKSTPSNALYNRLRLRRGRPALRAGSGAGEKLETAMKEIDIGRFRLPPGRKVDLSDWPTSIRPVYKTKQQYEQLLRDHVQKMNALQNLLYASNRYALLLIFQAMDAAGKDSVIKHVMSGANPQGCQVFSFKHPGAEELEHDFLWNAVRRLPERGHIGIFNRSYYEEVLIVRVHPDILRNENLPEEILNEKKLWAHRYRSILSLEQHLHHSGTRIVKFFLHLSKEEQRKRFLKRIDNPEKNWKFSSDDLKERECWKDYKKAYEHCLGATGTAKAPWYVVPADDKPTTQLIVSQIVLHVLEELDMSFPKTSPARQKELQQIRKKLEEE